MNDTWDSLSRYEQNALVATDAMGWHESHGPSGEPEWRYKSVARACSVKDFRPTEKIEQAWEVQERIAELGLCAEWAYHLADIVRASWGKHRMEGSSAMWYFAAVASADQRCHAAVLAVRGMNDA